MRERGREERNRETWKGKGYGRERDGRERGMEVIETGGKGEGNRE